MTAISVGIATAIGALVGATLGIFNGIQNFRWKRAELANSYLKDLSTNPELVFATRCLDWNGGRLALPESLRPYADDAKTIEHDRGVLERALRPGLLISEMAEDPRIQIYRVAIDSLLSWLLIVNSALDRRLFAAIDVAEVSYWTAKLRNDAVLKPFVEAFGYRAALDQLAVHFERSKGQRGG